MKDRFRACHTAKPLYKTSCTQVIFCVSDKLPCHQMIIFLQPTPLTSPAFPILTNRLSRSQKPTNSYHPINLCRRHVSCHHPPSHHSNFPTPVPCIEITSKTPPHARGIPSPLHVWEAGRTHGLRRAFRFWSACCVDRWGGIK